MGDVPHRSRKRTGKFDTRADREAREMEEYDELQRYREQRDLDTIAAQQDADRREMERMGDFESERPSRESDYYWNNTDFSRRLRFSRAVKPSALGDGKQRYYEVPFDKAVDKIVKNRKPIGNDQVFVSETPKVFADIGFARLPIMMTQKHVLTISSDAAALKSLKIGGNAHDMKAVLKQVPKAIQKPLMVIASETRPDSSVVAITQLKDRDGKTVIVPIALDGISPIGGGGLIDSHIITSAYGKGNVWSKLVEDAITKEINGDVGVFYIDTARANVVRNQLARAASGNSALQWLQLPRGRQNPDFVHSIADEGSPVKGGIVSQTATRQFKRWFDKSQVVDENGEPLVVYHGTGAEFNVFDGGAFFTDDYWNADGYANGERVMECYLSIKNPLVIDCKGRKWDDLDTPYGKTTRDVVASEEARKHDGVIFRNVKDNWIDGVEEQDPGTVYYIHDSAQAKSATDNIGTFDPGNPDIRFSRSGIFTGAAADYANRSRQGGKDDGPSLLKIGTGEGSQVYGWGLYGSTVRGVAEGYAGRRKQSQDLMYKGQDIAPVFKFPRNATPEELALKFARMSSSIDGLLSNLEYEGRKDKSYKPQYDAAVEWVKNHRGDFSERPIGNNIYEQTFFTDRAPSDESHLLKWYEPVTSEQKDWIVNAFAEGKAGKAIPYLDRRMSEVRKAKNGDDVYRILEKTLGSPKAASEFLARAGIDGVKYPVDSFGGKGVKDGDVAGWNYVSFRDDNIRVDHKWTDGQQRYSRRLFEFGNTNVGMAPKTAVGETTPGARAANRQRMAEERDPGHALWEVPWELSPNGPGGAPIQKPLALGVAETVRLVEALTGKSPTSFRRTKTGKNAEDTDPLIRFYNYL